MDVLIGSVNNVLIRGRDGIGVMVVVVAIFGITPAPTSNAVCDKTFCATIAADDAACADFVSATFAAENATEDATEAATEALADTIDVFETVASTLAVVATLSVMAIVAATAVAIAEADEATEAFWRFFCSCLVDDG